MLRSSGPAPGPRRLAGRRSARLAAELASQREFFSQELAEAVRSRAQAELVARLIADAIPGRVVYWDRDLRCQFANQGYFDWSGLRPEQVLGRLMQDVVGLQHMQQNRAYLDGVLAGRPQSFERETVGANGPGWHWIQYVPDIRDGEVKGFVVLALDISARRSAERALQASHAELERARDRAEAASRAKSAFLAHMSHEIRTPMNAIVGLTHLLQRAPQTPQSQQHLRDVDASAQHLLQVINDVLDMSKIEAGKLVLERDEFDPRQLLARALAQLAEAARTKGLDLQAEIDPALPPLLRGDAMRLTQMLLNLLSNAVKYTERGRVLLRARGLREAAGRVQLGVEVEDSGIGIEPQALARLFAPFEQADASISRRFGGTGLGLAITRHLALKMDGEAGARSVPGQGSCFWFTVWLERAERRERAPALLPLHPAELRLRQHHGGQRLLLAEDDPVNQMVAWSLLQAAGLEVDLVEDGAAALRAAAARVYDLVLLDLHMPVMDGISACREIRRLPGYAGVAVLALSGNAFAEDREACLAAGMNDHLSKPVAPETLYETLLRWLPARA